MLPLRNIPVIKPFFKLDQNEILQKDILKAVAHGLHRLEQTDGKQPVAICFDWLGSASYKRIEDFLSGVVTGLAKHLKNSHPLILVCEGDIGKTLGTHALEEISLKVPIISIDGITLQEFDYIDIGGVMIASGAVPVVIKSLLFPGGQ